MAIDDGKLNEFLGRFVSDLGATIAAGGIVIGHRLGLFHALAEGPATADELARRTETNPRYIAEWLRGQAAGGYVHYDAANDTYSLTEEQAFALTNPDGGVYMPGAFVLALGTLKANDRITAAFRSGDGMGWHEHDEDVFTGCEQFFRYSPAMSRTWCRPGCRVLWTAWWRSCGPARRAPTSAAGSGHRRCCSARRTRNQALSGRTITSARSSWPASGRPTRASPTGCSSRWPRRPGSPDRTTTLITTFDCLHDMGDPLSAAKHIRQALADDGTWMVVEPAAADDVPGNLNPVGRIYYNFSAQLCIPNALSQPGGYALGAQAGEAAIRRVATDAGFTRFRRATETPFNIVYEARP